ncbi:hypothetical protein [Azospirillum sp. sgz302134]
MKTIDLARMSPGYDGPDNRAAVDAAAALIDRVVAALSPAH